MTSRLTSMLDRTKEAKSIEDRLSRAVAGGGGLPKRTAG